MKASWFELGKALAYSSQHPYIDVCSNDSTIVTVDFRQLERPDFCDTS